MAALVCIVGLAFVCIDVWYRYRFARRASPERVTGRGSWRGLVHSPLVQLGIVLVAASTATSRQGAWALLGVGAVIALRAAPFAWGLGKMHLLMLGVSRDTGVSFADPSPPEHIRTLSPSAMSSMLSELRQEHPGIPASLPDDFADDLESNGLASVWSRGARGIRLFRRGFWWALGAVGVGLALVVVAAQMISR